MIPLRCPLFFGREIQSWNQEPTVTGAQRRFLKAPWNETFITHNCLQTIMACKKPKKKGSKKRLGSLGKDADGSQMRSQGASIFKKVFS